ncbi:MAG TPA: hypothetical protein P5175_09035 [Anaerohalosphaeraceae bacterium]|nr:hypothetical protein [Anaerohalosphaeraceae bacterium]HPO70144.1 hypothetical protein [Anaerohalosphaeraceae bacterium]HRS71979.1 hypothetical protein [Anaerohalosphaeraceae bacterium]
MGDLMIKAIIGWVCIVFLCVLPVYGVNTNEIEALRQRVQQSGIELSAADTAVISKFWSAALDQMLLSANSQDMVEVRRQLEAQRGNEYLSFYATAYIAEALKDIQAAYQNTQRIENLQQRINAERNLMILTANLASPKLAPIAVSRLADTDEVIRYWAVKAITQPAVIEQLSKEEVTRDPQAAEAILNALKERILSEPLTEIQKMMIDFAAAFNHPAARQILLSLSEQRLNAYRQWKVQDELVETKLLTALGTIAVLQQDAEIKKTFGKAFAELYSAVFQRYMKGAARLSAEQTEQLIAVISEIDQTVVNKTMGIQTSILRTLQRRGPLDSDYEMLFGNRQLAGELGLRFKFDYGKDASGKPITFPAELDPMPEAAKSPE